VRLAMDGHSSLGCCLSRLFRMDGSGNKIAVGTNIDVHIRSLVNTDLMVTLVER
jgi:hypothetical protein